MKYLLLIRHGAAAHDHFGGDFSRPLRKKGHGECKIMGGTVKDWFKSHGLTGPDRFVSSTAKRTVETTMNFSKSLNIAKDKLVFEESLYLPTLEECLEVLWGQEEEFIAICSHNPGTTYLADHLFNGIPEGFRTCGSALGRFNIDSWSEAQRSTGELLEFANP